MFRCLSLKKLMLCALTLCCQGVQANTYGGLSNRHHVVTVSNALRLQSESLVTVRGYITSSKGPDFYELKDTTGRIVVHITNEVWQELTVDSDTKIEVQGEMVREDGQVFIEADLVKISR